LARQLGYTETELEAIDSIEGMKRAFEPAVQAALLYAELMTRDAHDVTDAFFERLKEHYDDKQVIELTCVIGLTNYFNRFTTALRIDLSGTNEPYDSPGSPKSAG
jgi:alkylhydroperoxidase family enzyme